MVSLMKRVSVVLLLSTALISGQAEATTTNKVLPSLSAKLQSLRGQLRKVFGSEAALVIVSGVCIANSTDIINLLRDADPTISLTPYLVWGGVTLLLSGIVFVLNDDRKLREANEAYRRGINDGSKLDKLQDEPVEVNDRLGLHTQVFRRVLPDVIGLAHLDRIEDRIDGDVLDRIYRLIGKNGGFPLTVAREGVTFNNGEFTSYADLFGIIDSSQE